LFPPSAVFPVLRHTRCLSLLASRMASAAAAANPQGSHVTYTVKDGVAIIKLDSPNAKVYCSCVKVHRLLI
jgi:hypothetical protein